MPLYQAKAILGHDGMSKMWPSLEMPQCFRGFIYPECVMLAYLKGYAATVHEFEGEYAPFYGIPPKRISLPDAYKRHILQHTIGVISLEHGNAFHAVALVDSVIYDPRGQVYLLPENQYKHVKACITFEPRNPKFVTQYDINTLSLISKG